MSQVLFPGTRWLRDAHVVFCLRHCNITAPAILRQFILLNCLDVLSRGMEMHRFLSSPKFFCYSAPLCSLAKSWNVECLMQRLKSPSSRREGFEGNALSMASTSVVMTSQPDCCLFAFCSLEISRISTQALPLAVRLEAGLVGGSKHTTEARLRTPSTLKMHTSPDAAGVPERRAKSLLNTPMFTPPRKLGQVSADSRSESSAAHFCTAECFVFLLSF